MEENKISKYRINGKEYGSIEEVPEDLRKFLEPVENKKLIDVHFTKNIKFKFNGKEYGSLEEMPENARKILEDKNNNGIPDILEHSGFSTNLKIGSVKDADSLSPVPIQPKSSNKAVFLVILVLLAGFILYSFFK